MDNKTSKFQNDKTNNCKEKDNNPKNKTRKYSSKDKKDKNIPARNDWSFYAPSEQIAKDIASIPFNKIPGTSFRLPIDVQSGYSARYKDAALPSVLTVNYVPSIGVGNSKTEGINMAAIQLYAKIRKNNSGAKNYEAPDLMMYIMAIQNAYAQYFHCKRILGMAGLFNYMNHNIPNTLLYAMGVNAQDLRANWARYRSRLNLLARKLNSFAVPSYFKCVDRSAYINSQIFSDSDSMMGQFYIFKPTVYFTWSGTVSTTGTALQANAYPGGGNIVNFDVHLQVLEAQLDALFYDQDALTMSGDILKAFEGSQLYNVSEMGDDYLTPIAHDLDILSQIQNSSALRIMPERALSVSHIVDGHITQADQHIIQTITYRDNILSGQNHAVQPNGHVLNSHKDQPDYKDILEWSRLMSNFAYNKTEDGYHDNTVTSCGLECVQDYTIVRYNPEDNAYIAVTFGNQIILTGVGSYDESYNGMYVLFNGLTHFDFHPMVYALFQDSDYEYQSILGEVKKATIIPYDITEDMNYCAVYSAYYSKDLL